MFKWTHRYRFLISKTCFRSGGTTAFFLRNLHFRSNMSALSLTIAILVADQVYAKGGGGHASSHSSSSSESSSSKSSSSKSSSSKSGSSKTTSGGSGHSVIIVGSGSHAQCHDPATCVEVGVGACSSCQQTLLSR